MATIMTSGQSDLTQNRIATADGRLNRICQVAQMCLPMWADCRRLANTNELVLLRPTRVHNSNSKSIGSAISAQLTAENPILYNGRPFPLKLPLPIGGSGPQSNIWFPGPPESSYQTASRSVQPFLQGSLV